MDMAKVMPVTDFSLLFPAAQVCARYGTGLEVLDVLEFDPSDQIDDVKTIQDLSRKMFSSLLPAIFRRASSYLDSMRPRSLAGTIP